MKKSLTFFFTLLISLTSACKKAAPAASSTQESTQTNKEASIQVAPTAEDVSAKVASAETLFRKRDFPAALLELDSARSIQPKNSQILSLSARCYVEMRAFPQALQLLHEADEISPNNPTILFNIGEMHFVTKQWKKAIASFEGVTKLTKPEQTELRDLIEFKILLCHAGLENREEFSQRAASASIPAVNDTLRNYFTKAVVEFESNNEEQANKLLADAERAFPQRQDRAPWVDTLTEFGYSPR